MAKKKPIDQRTLGFDANQDVSGIENDLKELPMTEKDILSDSEIKTLVTEVVIPYAEHLSGTSLYDYQKQFAAGIAFSVLGKKRRVITGLFARQSGKTETMYVMILALGVLIPMFARVFKADNFSSFRKGDGSTQFKVGIFGPDLEKAGITYGRLKDAIAKSRVREILSDPELGIDVALIKGLDFPNGFSVLAKSANRRGRIEGHTFHMIFIDETQDIEDILITKSISPMRNFYGGTLVQVGTPKESVCYFQEQCMNNKKRDREEGLTNDLFRFHYEFDYTYVAKHRPDYLETVKEDAKNLPGGEESPAFRMAYKIEWLSEESSFIPRSSLLNLNVAIRERRVDKHQERKAGETITYEFIRNKGCAGADKHTEDQVFSIDYGKSRDSTVVTVAKVWWEHPVKTGRDIRYHMHIQNWLELKGDDHEKQLPKILDFLNRFNCSLGINDATGKGDPLHSRMANILSPKGIRLIPFVFATVRKSDMYQLFRQEILSGRVTFPYGEEAQAWTTVKRFVDQTSELVKEYNKDGVLLVHAPPGASYHDDYPDSLAMLVTLVNVHGRHNVESFDNQFYTPNTNNQSGLLGAGTIFNAPGFALKRHIRRSWGSK